MCAVCDVTMSCDHFGKIGIEFQSSLWSLIMSLIQWEVYVCTYQGGLLCRHIRLSRVACILN